MAKLNQSPLTERTKMNQRGTPLRSLINRRALSSMASFAVPSPKTSALFAAQPNHKQNPTPKHRNNSVVNFQSDFKSSRALITGSSSRGFQTSKSQKDGMRVSAQLNKVALQTSNSAPSSEKKVEATKTTSSQTTMPDDATISAFMNQVAELVQLVDSRDIVELELKQQGCEVVIRKKEALAPPPSPPMVMMQSGDKGDVTCLVTIPFEMEVEAYFLAKDDGIVAGIVLAEMIFDEVDPTLKVEWFKKDGDSVSKGLKFGKVQGRAYSIVIAERVVLNFMQRMSGIATLTKDVASWLKCS